MTSPLTGLRCSLAGRREELGFPGAPTGAADHLRGLSHAEMGPRGLRRDDVLFDEMHV